MDVVTLALARQYAKKLEIQGVEITGIAQNPDYTITFTFSSGDTWTTPEPIRGAPGEVSQADLDDAVAELQTMIEANIGLPYSIYPTGDDTDRTSEVEEILNEYGICRFEKGRFYVCNVHMPDNSKVEGTGASSEVVLKNAWDASANMWTFGDQTFTKTVSHTFDQPLPAGKYLFTATVESTDTDASACRINFYFADGTNSFIQIHRNAPETVEKIFEKSVVKIDLYASSSSSASTGDTATFSNIVLNIYAREAAFIMGYHCAVSDLSVLGSLTDITKSVDMLRNGILYLGTGEETTSLDTGIVKDCWMQYFKGGCISMKDTGYGAIGLTISNCSLRDSYAGIDIPHFSEYIRITNCRIRNNYYGILNNGGNNIFSNCTLNGNVIGVVMDNSDGNAINNTHGGITNCIIQHSTLKDIYINGCGAGYVFTGCNFGDDINIINSCRIIFTGCNFMSGISIDINGVYQKNADIGGLVLFNSSCFRDDLVTHVSDNPYVKFVACYNQLGVEVNPINV